MKLLVENDMSRQHIKSNITAIEAEKNILCRHLKDIFYNQKDPLSESIIKDVKKVKETKMDKIDANDFDKDIIIPIHMIALKLGLVLSVTNNNIKKLVNKNINITKESVLSLLTLTNHINDPRISEAASKAGANFIKFCKE